MNKSEFLKELRNALSGLPYSETEKTIDYYSEIIDDALEDGEEEQVVIARLGKIEDIAERVINETPISSFVKADVKRRKISTAAIILIILGSPFWLPVLVAVFAILFSFYLVVWTLVITLFIVFAAIALSGAAALILAPFILFSGSLLKAGLTFGTALSFAGIAILIFYISIWCAKLTAKFTVFCVRETKNLFIRKGRR